MGWYPLYDNEHLNFPEELREKVIKARLKSRSKHKDYDDDEYVWAIYWCEAIGPRGNKSFPSLAQRWKYRLQTNWQVDIEGPHVAKNDPMVMDGATYWKTIDECLSHFGLTREDRPSEYS